MGYPQTSLMKPVAALFLDEADGGGTGKMMEDRKAPMAKGIGVVSQMCL